MQLLDEQQRRHYCGCEEKSFQGSAPTWEDLSKKVPPHSNIGGGVWALHQQENDVGDRPEFDVTPSNSIGVSLASITNKCMCCTELQKH